MGSIEPLRCLLALGFNPNAMNHSQETPLFVATRTNNIDAASVLIDSGSDCRIQNTLGKFV